MKKFILLLALVLYSIFSIQVFSQGCYYGASFSHVNSGGGVVSFTNTSQMISSSYWSFGDGNYSNQNSPTHTYSSNGLYNVTLDLTYVWNMGVYGTLTCNETTSMNIMINNANSSYGCTDPLAANYNPSATIDDGSCILSASFVTLHMNDSYGDGWNGDTWTANSISGGTTYGPFSLNSGYSGSQSFIILGDCYDITVGGGLYPYETSWSLIDDNGTTLASGGSPYNTVLNTGNGSCTILGCTDSTATNYNANAGIDNGSCLYPNICGEITGVNLSDITHDRVSFQWDDMNDSLCLVDQIRIRYRELGTSTYSTKTMGAPIGNNTLCLNTNKHILNLIPATDYYYGFKIWYQDGTINDWHSIGEFTTKDECPNVGNLGVVGVNPTKAIFTWDASNGTYAFVRLKARVDSISNPTGADFFQIGGAGVSYGTNTKNKNGLTPGETYRGQSRTYCDPNGGAWKSTTWTPLVYWTQPTQRIEGGNAIANLAVYPNPARDVFNITFTSERVQDLRVRVMNIMGEEIIIEELGQFIGEYTKQINLEDNAKGIYFLEVETNDGVINKKLISQ
jgi:hypothetical protein